MPKEEGIAGPYGNSIFSFFKRTSILLSIVAAPIYTTTNSVGWFLFSIVMVYIMYPTLTGLQNAQIAGKTLFPGVPVGLSLVEISISVS